MEYAFDFGEHERGTRFVLSVVTVSCHPLTATGLFAVSNQIGLIGGASIGGAMLALGGFPVVGFFGLVAAVLAAVVVRVKVRDSEEFLEQVALRDSEAG